MQHPGKDFLSLARSAYLNTAENLPARNGGPPSTHRTARVASYGEGDANPSATSPCLTGRCIAGIQRGKQSAHSQRPETWAGDDAVDRLDGESLSA